MSDEQLRNQIIRVGELLTKYRKERDAAIKDCADLKKHSGRLFREVIAIIDERDEALAKLNAATQALQDILGGKDGRPVPSDNCRKIARAALDYIEKETEE